TANAPRADEPHLRPTTIPNLAFAGDCRRTALRQDHRARGAHLWRDECAGLAMSETIEVRDLRFRYPDGTEALQGITFSIGTEECVGLIGPNGAGKSTLLLHLNGLLPERLSGPANIFVNGQPVTFENLPEIRRQVGLLFQDPDDQLFCPTVGEDVA